MSKHHPAFYLITLAAALNLQFFTNSVQGAIMVWSPPPVVATIRIEIGEKPLAMVSGKFTGVRIGENRNRILLASSIAEINGLDNRIIALKLLDKDGNSLPFRKLSNGEFLAEGEIEGWGYAIDLSAPVNGRAAAHTSWISGRVGILMISDLLPQVGEEGYGRAWINFKLPGDWKISTGKTTLPSSYVPKEEGGEWFEVDYNDVLPIGDGWRFQKNSDTQKFNFAISGEWHFSDAEAADMVREVLDEYKSLFGKGPATDVQITISKFPGQIGIGEWQAETRGHDVTIISSDMPFKTQSLQRLHEQLRHEIFHLWVPNGLNLKGNYDWFYEGFALYQSLKTAVALNRIRFDDFLDTLSRAHGIDSGQTRRMSLIEASANRFSGANTQVYARGMLVAFLTDLALLENSKGKRSVEDIFRELYGKYGPAGERQDANTAVIGVMQANTEVQPIIEKYIRGAGKVEWSADLAAAGIDSLEEKGHTTLKVRSKLNGRQKALLDKLGYNNWRKLSRNSK